MKGFRYHVGITEYSPEAFSEEVEDDGNEYSWDNERELIKLIPSQKK